MSDWVPTLLSAAGGQQQQENEEDLDGVDQWEALSTSNFSLRKRQELAQ